MKKSLSTEIRRAFACQLINIAISVLPKDHWSMFLVNGIRFGMEDCMAFEKAHPDSWWMSK